MTALRVTSGARLAISAHATASVKVPACGILIGHSDEDGVLIDRALRCINVAANAAEREAFAIEPRVVVNVRRSLAGTPHSIVGFYYANEEGEPTEADLEHLRRWPGTALLIHGASGTSEIRAWWYDAGASSPREVGFEVVVNQGALAPCPD